MQSDTITNAEVEEILKQGQELNRQMIASGILLTFISKIPCLARALLEERQMLAKLHEFGCEDCSAALPCEAAKRLRQAGRK